MAIRYHAPKTPLQLAKLELSRLLRERSDWLEPHPYGAKYDQHIFNAKREAHLAELNPMIDRARQAVKEATS